MPFRSATFAVLLFLAAASHAATFTVTSSADSGPGTLRQAILDANATPDLDDIHFTVGSVTLAASLPPIINPVRIDGTVGGSRVHVQGPLLDGSFVFRFEGKSSGSTLRDTRVTGITALRTEPSVWDIRIAANDLTGRVNIAGVGHLIGGSEEGEGNRIAGPGGFTIHGTAHGLFRNSLVSLLAFSTTALMIGDAENGNTITQLLWLQNAGAFISGNRFVGNGRIQVSSVAPVTPPALITGNTFDGAPTAVLVSPGASGVMILANSMSTTGIPIDLGGDGPTPNDPAPDADAGANRLQNYPVLTSAVLVGGELTVSGTLASVPATTFRVDLFGNSAGDPDARTFLDSFHTSTDAAGMAAFTYTVPAALVTGDEVITSTAINGSTHDTSEVSAPVAVHAPGALALAAAADTVHEIAGHATIVVQRTGGTDGTVTVHYATANGTATAPADYTATSGTLTFGDGVASQTIVVPIATDGIPEEAETFTVTLRNATGGATLGTTTATITIAAHLPVEAVPTASTWALLVLALSLAALAAGAVRAT